MRLSPPITVGLLIAIALATAWAFATMLGQRFASGEVYPAYSTRRADPLGARALFEALDRLPGITCERNFKRLAKLSDPIADTGAKISSASRRGETLVLLDVAPGALSDGDALDGDALRDFAAAGGRVIVTLEGQRDRIDKVWEAAEARRKELREERRKEAREKEDKEKKNNGDKTGPKEDADKQKAAHKDRDEEEKELLFRPVKSLRELFHVANKQEKLEKMPDEGYTLATPEGIAVLKGELPPWFSTTTLDLNAAPEDDEDEDSKGQKNPPPDSGEPKSGGSAKTKPGPLSQDAWKVLATIECHPVLAERRISHGSIVIATDSRFASNQELMLKPASGFLAWLIGDAHHVIFDETHLGTQENPGIMTLARRFRLHGFFLGGVLLFALFVWQSSGSLVPPNDGLDSPARTVAGQGAVAGLVSLLRRGIPRTQLLHTCFEQWERGHLRSNAALQSRIEKARALLPRAEAKRLPRGMLVRLYQQLCETIHPRRN